EELSGKFYLKNNGVELFSSPKDETISSTLNHWVHHRGQLTVYMRLNNIPVPSIYGPSADEKVF
ncbi:MAG: DinB family protein, partial [Ignavibacteriaceae bacterium]